MNKIRLTLLGDVFPANLTYNAGFGIASKYLKHKGKPWKKSLNTILKDSDVVFGNLESPLIYDDKFSDNNSFAGSYRLKVK